MADEKKGWWTTSFSWYPESFYATKASMDPLGPKLRLRVLFSGILLATAVSFGVGTWYFRYSQAAGLNADTMVADEDKTGGKEGYTCTMMTPMYPRTVTCEDSTCPAHRLPRVSAPWWCSSALGGSSPC